MTGGIGNSFLWVLVGYLGVFFWLRKFGKPDLSLHLHMLICGAFFGPPWLCGRVRCVAGSQATDEVIKMIEGLHLEPLKNEGQFTD